MNKIEAKIIELPKIYDSRGNLTVIEGLKQTPFDIAHTRWIYGMPSGSSLPGYALRSQSELVVVISGSCDVTTRCGSDAHTYHMQSASQALLLPAMLWHHLSNFSTNTIVLVLSSGANDTNDYIYNEDTLKAL